MGLAGHLSVPGLATVVTVGFLLATWLAKLKREPRRLEQSEGRAPFSAVALFPPLAATMIEPQANDREQYPLCLDNPRHVRARLQTSPRATSRTGTAGAR
jgi:hypothetical protein